MIKKISLFFSAIAIGILSIFGSISTKNAAEPQYFLENTQVKNAIVETITNEYIFYLDNTVNNYNLTDGNLNIFSAASYNAKIEIYLDNQQTIEYEFSEFRFACHEDFGVITNSFWLDLNKIVIIKCNSNLQAHNILVNTWYYITDEETFIKCNYFKLIDSNLSDDYSNLEEINNDLIPYIGNLTSLPSEEPTPPLEQINTLISDIVNWFTNIFNGLGNVFYDPTAQKLTAWGTVLFIGVAIMLISMALKWVISLIRGV